MAKGQQFPAPETTAHPLVQVRRRHAPLGTGRHHPPSPPAGRSPTTRVDFAVRPGSRLSCGCCCAPVRWWRAARPPAGSGSSLNVRRDTALISTHTRATAQAKDLPTPRVENGCRPHASAGPIRRGQLVHRHATPPAGDATARAPFHAWRSEVRGIVNAVRQISRTSNAVRHRH